MNLRSITSCIILELYKIIHFSNRKKNRKNRTLIMLQLLVSVGEFCAIFQGDSCDIPPALPVTDRANWRRVGGWSETSQAIKEVEFDDWISMWMNKHE